VSQMSRIEPKVCPLCGRLYFDLKSYTPRCTCGFPLESSGKEQKAWTMNCILAGGTAMKLILEGKTEEAKRILRKLTSELSGDDIDYIFFRLIVVKTFRPPSSV